jgi:hypothetical protein
MFRGHVLASQFQTLRFSLKAAFGHSPLSTQSQCCGKSSSGVADKVTDRKNRRAKIAGLIVLLSGIVD